MRGARAILAALALAACSSDVPLAPRDLDEAAKRFDPPPPGLAALYVVREGTFVSAPVTLLVDRRRVGLLGYDTYSRLELPPGGHAVRVQDLDSGQQLAVTNVQLAVGDIRFVSVGTAALDSPLTNTITEMNARELPGTQGRTAVAGKRLVARGR
ncbi:MAG: hypothetical protein J0J01_29115 [Reyranella sp.]|uniref:hypothetical protein n=1 Tax=Reyranella sp. TaxID=1929291 RepID=UPI001ACC0522|nr:hypothetical protein [Reyranella sp.]MBN9090994.1 hypothetical protein [Reyranella sp.]